MKDIRVIGLAKAFGTTPAVDHVSFEVPAGSLATLLGPQRLREDDHAPAPGRPGTARRRRDVRGRPVPHLRCAHDLLSPEKRRMGMVFQTYAIWPHMTVFENIAFPLREKRAPATEIRERVMAMLQTLGLDGFHDRSGSPALGWPAAARGTGTGAGGRS